MDAAELGHSFTVRRVSGRTISKETNHCTTMTQHNEVGFSTQHPRPPLDCHGVTRWFLPNRAPQ